MSEWKNGNDVEILIIGNGLKGFKTFFFWMTENIELFFYKAYSEISQTSTIQYNGILDIHTGWFRTYCKNLNKLFFVKSWLRKISFNKIFMVDE